jgi:aldose 1-epimerase
MSSRLIAIEANHLKAEISTIGAYLLSLSGMGKELILRGDLKAQTRGGMAILIPYANRVKGGKYSFDGVEYELPKNREGNAIHGLVMGEVWEVEEESTGRVTLSHLLSHPGYPTLIRSQVSYQVSSNSLKVDIRVSNIGDRRAPLTVGAHPYFLVSGNWRIEARGAKKCVAANLIPTGELVDYHFGEDGSYDDCFLVPNDVILTSSHSSVLIRRQGMPFLQVYTGIKGAVAVEPMSGAPDAFHNSLGLTVLEPGSTASFSFSMEFGLNPFSS